MAVAACVCIAGRALTGEHRHGELRVQLGQLAGQVELRAAVRGGQQQVQRALPLAWNTRDSNYYNVINRIN